jgi:4-hydroxythreonine-4-phosphate dehydrogenase
MSKTGSKIINGTLDHGATTDPASEAPALAVTPGEPAGIGPELCVMLAQQPPAERLIVIADRNLLAERARLLGLPWRALPADAGTGTAEPGALRVLHVPLSVPSVPGVLAHANAAYVLRTLEIAADGCLRSKFRGLVTAPVHKGIINDAGIPFTGHTEFLAERTRAPHVVMMLAGGGVRVALATTHLPVKDIAAAISAEALERTLRVLHADLRTRFGIPAPRIAVAGLNPHAGESGHLGREEIEIIAPLLERLRHEGMTLAGPLPADTLFTRERCASFDCALAMYHDQGLPVLKYASFGHAVNITLGLPIVRTSVDHGTALDIAGKGRADLGSLRAAIAMASELARVHN